MKCFYAVLTSNDNTEIKVGKVESSNANCKKKCALAILKYLRSISALPTQYEMRLALQHSKTYFRVFVFYCSVEFSWRGILQYIYNTKGFEHFLEDMAPTSERSA